MQEAAHAAETTRIISEKETKLSAVELTCFRIL